MVITTWDHFKHLQLGSELEWRDATGVRDGFSLAELLGRQRGLLSLFCSPQQTLCPAPTTHKNSALVHLTWLGLKDSFLWLMEWHRPLNIFRYIKKQCSYDGNFNLYTNP